VVDAVDTYAEGLQFKALKVVDQGKTNEVVWHMVRDNIRISDLVVGDMNAQISAAQIGAQRFLDLVKRYGMETVNGAYEDLMDYSERLMRDAIREIPDGVYAAETFIDGYLDDPDPARKDLKIAATITVKGDEMTVDLTGTAPQVSDRPINMPFEGTVDCAIWLTLRSILLDSVVYGQIPQNSGLTRPIKIVAPKGCLANPIFPAPVIARFCPGNALADTVMKAMAKAVPDQVSAGIGNLRVIAFSGQTEADQQWVHMEILEGSYGGRQGGDGMDTVDTLYANTRNNPVEDIESHLPLRVNRYELRENVVAPGEWRGGIGSVREFVYLTDGGFAIEGDGQKYRPWGFAGGTDGSPGELFLHSGKDKTSLVSKVAFQKVKKGDRLVAFGPSGGGYGDPFKRDPAAVLENVVDGLIDASVARDHYGVVIANGKVDAAATDKLRAGKKN
jgi:N-methylhydantoinase B